MIHATWSEEIRSNLRDLLDGPPGLAAFDFDNTLIYQDLGEACMHRIALGGELYPFTPWFWEEVRHPILSEELYASLHERMEQDPTLATLGADLLRIYEEILLQSGVEAAYRWSRVLFAGREGKDLEQLASRVFAEELRAPVSFEEHATGLRIPRGIRIYEEIRELIAGMRERDWDIRIVTASPVQIIRAVIGHWGLAPEAVIGMELEERDGTLAPVIREPMTYGWGKVAALRNATEEPLLFAAGDSFTDLDLLLHARYALLIHRGNGKLLERARESGFWIQPRFFDPPPGENPPELRKPGS